MDFFKYGVDELKKAIHPNIEEYYNWRSSNRKKALSKARSRTFNFLSPSNSQANLDGEEYSPSIIRHDTIQEEEQLSEPMQEFENEGETQDLKEIQEPLERWLFDSILISFSQF